MSVVDISPQEKETLTEITFKYKKAFSLPDEIEECPNIITEIEVIDKFFVWPFQISNDDKPILDWQMKRLTSLGILSKTNKSHTSPVMLIIRKLTRDKCQ